MIKKNIWILLSFLFYFAAAGELGAARFNAYLGQLQDIGEGKYLRLPGQSRSILKSFSFGSALPEKILVFGKGDANALLKYGAQVQTRAGKFFTAFIRTDSLASVKNENAVDFLNFTPYVQPLMNVAATYVSANQTYAAGYKGNDVIVGVVDTGIDFTHPDFTTENGLSRIINIWDQTDIRGNHPYGFDYGWEWTKDDIDKGLCLEVDISEQRYHWTHVTGIAAGNGNASGGLYRGISPGAPIIFVKLDFSSLGSILDAVSYIFFKAKQYNKPCVINLSLGSMSGSHTEYDDFNQAMDAVVDYYGQQGHIIVWSAGNSGNTVFNPEHTIHNVSTVTATTSLYNYNSGTTMKLEYWFNFSNLNIAVVRPSGTTNVPMTNTSMFSSIVNSDLSLQTGVNSAGEKYISISMNSGTSGNWRMVFGQAASAVTVDGYLVSYSTGNSFVNPTSTGTLTGQAAQKLAISVGAMVTRTVYTNYLGMPYNSTFTLYNIAPFSSRGPTRDGKNKPEVAAPGSLIIAPLAYKSNRSDKVNDYYRAMEGTSMSAPVVTGIIAQLLEKEPYLTVDDIKTKFSFYTKLNVFKISRTWDPAFGYGIADLAFLTATEPLRPALDVTLKNNIMNTTQDKDNLLYILFRSNSTQLGKTVRAVIYDKLGNLIKDYGSYAIRQIEVKEYIWNGKDQFERTVQPGLYFVQVAVDNAYSRYSVLVVR